MPDRMTRSRTFIVHFKEEVDAQWAATILGAHAGVVSVGAIDDETEALLRNLRARVASATPQQR
jgi:hypothetical protein